MARSRFFASTSRHYSPALAGALVAPLLLLLLLGFLYPVGRLLWGSVFIPDFSLQHYRQLVDQPLYLNVMRRTIEISLIVAVSTFLLAYPVALAMTRVRGTLALVAMACVLVPLWTSALIRSYAWIVLLQRTGIINSILVGAGFVDEPLRLLYTEGAVYMAMTHVLLPFMVLPIYGALKSIPPELTRAARSLGASRLSAFWRVTLPLSLPGVYAGVLMTFILALGFYITPALVGGPRTLMMSTLIAQQAIDRLDWPFAGALSTLLLVATLAFVIGFRRLLTLSHGFAHGV